VWIHFPMIQPVVCRTLLVGAVAVFGGSGCQEPPPVEAQGPPPSGSAESPQRPDLTFAFAGDVIFGRYRDSFYRPVGDRPFASVAPLFDADVALVNLETPLVRNLPAAGPEEPRNKFGAAAAWANDMARAGITAVTLANNHAFDQGQAGVRESPRILREVGIAAFGASVEEGPAIRVEPIEVRGWRVGVVAVTTIRNHPPGWLPQALPWAPAESLATRVVTVLEAARNAYDLLLVAVHWGAEYARRPDSTQRAAAHAMVEAGADLVIGHHPHVLQGVELLNGRLVAYSLGNFVFDNISQNPRYTGVLRVRMDGESGCVEHMRFDPVFIDPGLGHRPMPADAAAGQIARERMTTLSAEMGAAWEAVGDGLEVRGVRCEAER
jgi:poly-gamma-glutamate capsule biosynthesis protein CapA/YwtB (metallophosphatase superfamily)